MLRRSCALLKERWHCRAFSLGITAMGDSAQGEKKRGLSLLILFVPCATTFGLGTWQLMRREWKRELIEHKRNRFAEEPVPLGDILHAEDVNDLDAKESPLEYRRVVCEGVFDDSKSIFIGPRLKKIGNASQRGYLLITPLYPVPNASQSSSFLQPPVLVNRGWVPYAWREELERTAPDPPVKKPIKYNRGAWWKIWKRTPSVQDSTTPEPSETKGFVRVCGVVRGGEEANMFVPFNSPSTGQWFYVDVPLMAEATGLPPNTPYVEVIGEAANDEEFPLPKAPEDLLKHSLMPSDHLNYALTWYTLSAATTYMAVKRIQQKSPRKKIM